MNPDASHIEGSKVSYRIAWLASSADDEIIDNEQVETYYLSRSKLFSSIKEAKAFIASINEDRKPVIIRQCDNGAFELKTPKPVTAQTGRGPGLWPFVIKQPFDEIKINSGSAHWCAYVGVKESNPLHGMDASSFRDLNVGEPEVNGDLNYSGKLKGEDPDLWFFGWDYNHSWNWDSEKKCPITPLETDVMGHIRSCCEWIGKTAWYFKQNLVSHNDCPKCTGEWYHEDYHKLRKEDYQFKFLQKEKEQ